MTPSDRRLWLDLQSARYLAAIERSDFDAQSALWALAADDPELDDALHLVHADLLEEEQERTTAAVTEAVAKHLPSAEIVRPTAGPVTVGMVADELFRHTPARLSAAAHQLNDRLRASAAELPAELGLTKFTTWAEAKFGTAEGGYWKAFYDALIKLDLRRSVETEYQLAARSPRKPEGRK